MNKSSPARSPRWEKNNGTLQDCCVKFKAWTPFQIYGALFGVHDTGFFFFHPYFVGWAPTVSAFQTADNRETFPLLKWEVNKKLKAK